MKNWKLIFKQIVVVFILNLLFLGCTSKDDSSDSGSIQNRTIIKMDPPINSDIDWNEVKLVWNEEFNESEISDKNWAYETNDPNNPYTDGLQIYQKENVDLSGGRLKIYAKEEAGFYTSGRLTSKYAFKYGRIEISAKLPANKTKGIWAKIALIGENIDIVGWPQCGEIDIMDYFTNTPNEIYNYLHSGTNNAGNGTLLSSNYHLESAEEEFHAYGILWTDKYIKFYIESPNNVTYTFLRPSSTTQENWPFDMPFYLFTGMVIGGEYGGDGVHASLFPAVLEIDYIRVYHPQ